MEFKEAISSGLSNYTTFSGRASRSEFWWWQLFYVVAMLVVYLVGVVIMMIALSMGMGLFGAIIPTVLILLLVLGLILPTLSVTVRRLHDVDKSGWWYFIGLIPLVGTIVLLYFFVIQGTSGENRFGADPLGGVNEEIFA
jgi:uncharacterized membrane protein YhaH (DUF805 family)